VAAVSHHGPVPAIESSAWVLVGQDGGQSIELDDGDTLFVFADTLLAYPDAWRAGWPESRWPIRRDQGRFLANCAARAGGAALPDELARLRYLTDGSGWPRELLEATPAEGLARVRFWPEHGVCVAGQVYLFYLGIEHLSPGTWGFRTAGTGLALLDPRTGATRRLRWDNGDWRLWPDLADGSRGGVQVLRAGDHAYVFGSLRHGEATTARLARVALDALDQRGAYEFLCGSGPLWSRDPARALDLGPCGNEFSVSWNLYLGAYLMCYAERGERGLCLRAAEHPWGPYSEPARVGGLPIEARNQVAALACEHARYAEDGGRVLWITYCQPNFTRNSMVRLELA
jgi:hypothetical protein